MSATSRQQVIIMFPIAGGSNPQCGQLTFCYILDIAFVTKAPDCVSLYKQGRSRSVQQAREEARVKGKDIRTL
jgi:hypothetical protein